MAGESRKRTTKAELVENVYDQVGGLSKKEAAELVDLVFDEIRKALVDRAKVKISRFGNFVVRTKRERTGRDLHNHRPTVISARKVVTFRPSQVLKAILNPHRKKNNTP